MSAAALLLLYAAGLTWLCPPVLDRITCRGVAPRLSVAAWVIAIITALAAWVTALAGVMSAVARSVVDGSAVSFCLELLGGSSPPVVVVPAAAAGAAVLALALTAFVGRRMVLGFVRIRHRSGEYARSARIIGTPTGRANVVVVSSSQPAAYCVAGRPHAIVITSAAMQHLNRRQLAAVLAHEDAHIRGRHHLLLMVMRAMANALPGLPLFTGGVAATRRLLEMCADDAAARRHGIRPLVESLASLAKYPAAAVRLGAADTAVAARVARLASRADRRRLWGHRITLTATIGGTVIAPALIGLFCSG